ncbi:hypothetical protein [Corynebacterium urinipleomorphum]|uniref:hypothetical protein n=1 Tax=Corynebacterium urinipleomorphum TaxID=1852380 RepID=UPI0011777C5E|nr:hypothetical protein [Corynebacterium urinipleomorphum]
MTASTTRKSVALTPEDLDVVQRLREAGSPEREYLENALGQMPANLSESQAIAELVALGARSVRERALDSAYEAYAQQLLEEEVSYKDATRARRKLRADRREQAQQ